VLGSGCTDIDECTDTTICGVSGTCSNTPPGEYTCTCEAGYEFPVPGETGCVDIDECNIVATPCDPLTQQCLNSDGSYTCTCNDGYVEDTAGNSQQQITCANLDECLTECMVIDFYCHDMEGGYDCLYVDVRNCRGTSYCCTDASPCTLMDGPCNTDTECLGALICGVNNCKDHQVLRSDETGTPFKNNDDCCIPAG
jgi:hypothetical protein